MPVVRQAIFTACLAASLTAVTAAWTGVVQAALRCDLAYEVFSAATVPPPADLDHHQAVTRAEAEALPDLLDAALSGDDLTLSAPKVTWGGWRWSNSPSIHLQLSAEDSEAGWRQARELAAGLAWLYEQEAVLLACDAPEPADPPERLPRGDLVDSWLVTAEPESFFQSRDSLFAFYASLLAQAGHLDLGYTRLGADFWTVDFAGDLERVLRKATGSFEQLSAGALSFDLQRRPVAVTLVSGDELRPDRPLLQARKTIRERRERLLQSSSSVSPGATSPSETTSQ